VTIDPQLAEIALEYVEGTAFERFFQAFYPQIVGINLFRLGACTTEEPMHLTPT